MRIERCRCGYAHDGSRLEESKLFILEKRLGRVYLETWKSMGNLWTGDVAYGFYWPKMMLEEVGYET